MRSRIGHSPDRSSNKKVRKKWSLFLFYKRLTLAVEYDQKPQTPLGMICNANFAPESISNNKKISTYFDDLRETEEFKKMSKTLRMSCGRE